MRKPMKLFLLIVVIVLLSSCVKTMHPVEPLAIQDTELPENHTQESAPLILGGKHYVGRVGDVVVIDAIGTQDWIEESRKCFLEDAASLLYVSFDIDPLDPNKMNTLENIELLTNVKRLRIYGENLDSVDLTPLSALSSLEFLFIKGDICRPPDLTSLEKLTEIVIRGSFLESFEGLGAPNVREMTIEMETFDSMAPLSNLTELEFIDIGAPRSNLVTIGNIRNVPKLKSLFLGTGGIIDLTGIEQITGLVDLRLNYFSTLINTQGISGLHNLEILVMYGIEDENPSIEYLRGLPNLQDVCIESIPSIWSYKIKEPYQILDISPLGESPKLENIDLRGFIIKNVSALNHLENLRYNAIILHESRLLDETEAQRATKWLIFNVSILRDG